MVGEMLLPQLSDFVLPAAVVATVVIIARMGPRHALVPVGIGLIAAAQVLSLSRSWAYSSWEMHLGGIHMGRPSVPFLGALSEPIAVLAFFVALFVSRRLLGKPARPPTPAQ